MRYDFKDTVTGKIIEVERPMSNPPADEIEMGGRILRRIYSPPMGMVPKGSNGGVEYGDGNYLSRSLPFTSEVGEPTTFKGQPAKKLRCGAYATLRGQRIVESGDAAKRHCADAGYVPADT